jgi:hypothetical protein
LLVHPDEELEPVSSTSDAMSDEDDVDEEEEDSVLKVDCITDVAEGRR